MKIVVIQEEIFRQISLQRSLQNAGNGWSDSPVLTRLSLKFLHIIQI